MNNSLSKKLVGNVSNFLKAACGVSYDIVTPFFRAIDGFSSSLFNGHHFRCEENKSYPLFACFQASGRPDSFQIRTFSGFDLILEF